MDKKSRWKRRAPIVHIGIRAASKMICDAVKEFPNENLGVFLGTRSTNRNGRVIFKINSVHIISNTARDEKSVDWDDEIIEQLRKKYGANIIGDFHSHPPKKRSSKPPPYFPSHDDLDTTLEAFGPEAIFGIIRIEPAEKTTKPAHDKKPKVEHIRFTGPIRCHKAKLRCVVKKTTKREGTLYISRFKIRVYFCTFKEETKAIRRNKKALSQFRMIFPKIRRRKKIHKS